MTRSKGKRCQTANLKNGSNIPKNKHKSKHALSKVAASPSSKKKRTKKATTKPAVVPSSPSVNSEPEEPTPSQTFFEGYSSSFTYDKNSSVASEFRRMYTQLGWRRDDPEREEAFEGYKKALSMQFNGTYGTNENGLPEWQRLCDVIGIDPVPMDIKACREAVRNAHVNLVDLVDQTNTGERVNTFPTERALSDYTKETRKFFPRDDVHAGGLLRYLLRHIMNPRRGKAGISVPPPKV